MTKFAFILIALIPLKVMAETFNDSTLALSPRTLNYFLQAAECLSLKATIDEKQGFLTTRRMDLEWDVYSGQQISNEWLVERIAAEDQDQQEIYNAIKKYCPLTARSIASSVELDGLQSHSLPIIALSNLVVRFISVDILDKSELQAIFENENSALGINSAY